MPELAVMVLTVALLLGYMLVWVVIPHWLFKRTFGHPVPSESDPALRKLFMTRHITPVLTERAHLLREAYEEQRLVLEAIKNNQYSYNEAVERKRKVDDSVLSLKSNFYRAYNIAKKYGFKLREGYAEYLQDIIRVGKVLGQRKELRILESQEELV